MTWAIKSRFGFYAVKVVSETEKTVVYVYDSGGGHRRGEKRNFLDWRGDEETARMLVAKLTSAQAEYDRRSNAAFRWFKDRQAEILASKAMTDG